MTTSLIVQGEPQCLTLRDAVATRFEIVAPTEAPELPPRHSSFKAYTRGCIYEAGGARMDLSVRVGGVGGDQTKSIDPAILPPEQRGGTWLTGRTLYLGPFMNHYGHFITESLSRYWHQEAGAFDHYVAYPFIHNNGAIEMQAFHRYLAGLVGVPIDRVTILRSQTVFDEIVVPEQLWTYNTHVNLRMREIYRGLGARHAAKQAGGRLFLSRTSSPRLANIAEVEDVFAGFGFRVVYPEQIAIEQQLALYANCAVLAGVSGSAMHNCLFSRAGLMTIEVGDSRSRRHPVMMQRIANELAQVDARFIPFGERDDKRIEVKKVRRQLMEILGERPRLGLVMAARLKRRVGGLTARSGPKARKRVHSS